MIEGEPAGEKSTARSCRTVFLCQLRPKAFILYYACVKIHNIPNCYWQDPFKYDILRVTHKAGSFKAPGWYRKRADTGADRPCFCVCLLICDLYLAKERERRKNGKTKCLRRHAGTAYLFVDSSVNRFRFLIGHYDFFRPYGLWLYPAGHHECDNPSHPDYHRQPDGRP